MPVYEYECIEDGTVVELIRPMSKADEPVEDADAAAAAEAAAVAAAATAEPAAAATAAAPEAAPVIPKKLHFPDPDAVIAAARAKAAAAAAKRKAELDAARRDVQFVPGDEVLLDTEQWGTHAPPLVLAAFPALDGPLQGPRVHGA